MSGVTTEYRPVGGSAGAGGADPSLNTNSLTASSLSKTVKWALAFFAISAVAITVTILLTYYPTAPKIFYAVFSVTAFLSLVALAIDVCKKKPNPPVSAPQTLDATPSEATSLNPFGPSTNAYGTK